MTHSDAMIAMSAELATDRPNVGPISEISGSPRMPYASSSASVTAAVLPETSSEIWTTLGPRSSFWIVWIFASAKPAGVIVVRTCSTVAGFSSAAVIRVPDSKSIPKFRPFAPIASVQTSRIRPDIEKNQRDAPMKSNVIGFFCLPAPSADGCLRIRVPRSASRIAWVASTAVKSDTIVPTPRTKAKPLTPAVARMKRMNATSSVTTFASTIVAKPFL